MCIDFETSISTYIFSILSSIYLWNRNHPSDRWFTIFGLTFSSMQLVEALLHKNLDNKDINRKLSLIAFLVIFLEPLANNVGGIIYNDKSFFIKTTLAYIIYMVYIFAFKFPDNKDLNTTKDCNLQWHWLRKITTTDWLIFLFFLGMPSLYYSYPKNYIVSIGGTLAFLYANYVSGFMQSGALWCTLVNLLYIGVIMVN